MKVGYNFSVLPVNGLINRLRCIASSYLASKFLGFDFNVLWYNGADPSPYCSNDNLCACDITSLFIPDEEFLPIRNIDFDFKKIRKNKQSNIGPLNNTYYYQYDDNKALSFISKRLTSNHVLIGGGKFYGSDSDIANYYSSLNPVSFISQSINYFWKTYASYRVLGVQIRGTDMLKAGFTPWAKKSLSTHDIFKAFDKCIDKIYDQYDYIFLSTDEIEIIDLLSSKYSNVIFYPKTEIKRNSKDAIQLALIDWLLLSKCKYILHTKHSSFGEEAARVIGLNKSLSISYE